MILYRKSPQLRVRRMSAPEPPFWCATAVAPYSARRSEPVAVDYALLRASASDRTEVAVCSDVTGELDRSRGLTAPLLVDAAGRLETVFRRGAEAFGWCARSGLDALLLLSSDGALPERAADGSVVAVAAWPADPAGLEAIFSLAAARRLPFGVFVPVVYPVTTDLATLEAIADAAARHGAAFLASAAVDLEPAAKQALAQAERLGGDDDRYAMLFHGRIEPVALATERHVAALAAERGLADSIPPPASAARTNWNAAAMLMLTASRMMAMELDLDLAGSMARSARAAASLDKPLARIAESASLSIVDSLDETSVEMLTEWLDGGSASFAGYVDGQWRLRRA